MQLGCSVALTARYLIKHAGRPPKVAAELNFSVAYNSQLLVTII
jgi:hypothetical protein